MISVKFDQRPWDTSNEGLRQIFCAALQGICANPNFFGPIMQQHPDAAVEFADQIVLRSMRHKGHDPDA